MHILLLTLFFAVYLLIHLLKRKSSSKKNNYFLAGRKIGIFPLAATIIVSQYGWINGVFEVYLLNGPAAWLILSLPYLIFNIVWIWLGKYLYQKTALTTPQLLGKNYSPAVGKIGAFFYLIILLPIMYIHMGSEILEQVFHIPFAYGAAIFIILSALAIFFGGFEKLVWTDLFLFFIIYFGLAVVFFYFYNITEPIVSVQKECYQSVDFSNYINWILMALIVFIDPSIHQRLWAGEHAGSIKKTMGISILGWLIFDLLVIGIVSYSKTCDINDVYGILAQLPEGLNLLFSLMLLAVILSTSNTYFNITYNTLSFDLLAMNPSKSIFKKTALALILATFTYIISVYVFKSYSVVDILFKLNPVCISALFLPFISIFLPSIKLSSRQVIVQIILSATACLLCQLFPINWVKFAVPVLVGLSVSLLVQLIFKLSWQEQRETRN